MNSLPFPLFPLLCISILSSTFIISLTAFTFSVSTLLWIVPPAVIITFILHVVFVLLANSDDNAAGSLRVFSATLVSGFFLAVAVWAATTIVLVVCAVHLLTGRLPLAPRGREWAIITASVVSLLETAFMATIAVQTYKVRQKLRYKEKWRWRPNATSLQWGITQSQSSL